MRPTEKTILMRLDTSFLCHLTSRWERRKCGLWKAEMNMPYAGSYAWTGRWMLVHVAMYRNLNHEGDLYHGYSL
jgi:hypothetical protein